jgi:hypothetical protein
MPLHWTVAERLHSGDLVGTVLALFGLGVVPAAVRRDKRRFWFRRGAWVRVPPAGSLPH